MSISLGHGSKPIKLSPKKIGWSNLNLLQFITEKKRRTIAQRFRYRKKSPRNYDHVWEYIMANVVAKQKMNKPNKNNTIPPILT